MYLNYQIEHHLFPNLPMRQYRRIQPQVKALCAEFGLPYLQQSVWQRLVKMIQIAVGSKRMLRSPAPWLRQPVKHRTERAEGARMQLSAANMAILAPSCPARSLPGLSDHREPSGKPRPYLIVFSLRSGSAKQNIRAIRAVFRTGSAGRPEVRNAAGVWSSRP